MCCSIPVFGDSLVFGDTHISVFWHVVQIKEYLQRKYGTQVEVRLVRGVVEP